MTKDVNIPRPPPKKKQKKTTDQKNNRLYLTPFLSRILRSGSLFRVGGKEKLVQAFGVTAVPSKSSSAVPDLFVPYNCLAKHSFHSLRDSQTKRMCFSYLGGRVGIVLTQNCQDATIPSNLFLLLRRGLTFVLFERTQLISMFHYGPS